MNHPSLITTAALLLAAAVSGSPTWAATRYATTVLSDKPVAYWNFDEADGNAVQQAPLSHKPVTTENDLVPTGGVRRASHAAIASGLSRLGNCAEFQGNDWFLATALRAGKSEIAGAYAVEFWMQVQGENTSDRHDYLANIGGNAPALIYDFKSDQLEMFGGNSRTDGGPVFNDTEWHHVLWVYYGDSSEGVADRVDAFFDGVQYPSIGNMLSRRMSLGQILVGAALTNGADAFEGRLDELAIYDLSALPDETAVAAKIDGMVAGHLDAARSANAPAYASTVLADQPLLYWNFDEAEGNAIQKAPIALPVLNNANNDLAPNFNAQRISHGTAGSDLELGNAIDLDGQGSFFGSTGGMELGYASLNGPWAVEFWFQLQSEQKMRYFLNMGSDAVSRNSPAIIYGYFGPTIEVYGAGRSGTNGVPVVDQNWHHLLVVNHATPASEPNRVDFYLDNVHFPNVGGDFRKAVNFQGVLLFGAAVQNPDPGESGSIQGRLDELAFYDLSGYTNTADLAAAATAMAASHYAAGFGTSNGGTITLAEQPKSLTAQRGTSATFEVKASATGTNEPLLYQWQRNGVSISGATNASYSIPRITVADIGTNSYRVRISAGPVFTLSEPAHLIVPEPPAAPPTPYAQQVLADKPLLYWNFDEFTGPAQQQVPLVRAQPATENDLVPVGSAADRVSHASLGDGLNKLGNALSLDGASFMRAESLRLAKQFITNAYVLETWVRLDANHNQYLANFGPAGADNAPAMIYGFNPAYFELFGGGSRTTTHGPAVEDNAWHHLVWVNYSTAPANSTNLVDAYLDGTLLANAGGGFSRNADLRALMYGAALPSGADALVGALDEFAVYDLAGLNQDEVRAKGAAIAANHFAAAQNATGPSYTSVVLADQPLLYYNFDEASGNARQIAPVTLPALDNSVNALVAAGAQRVEHSVLNDGLTLGHAADFNGVSHFQTAGLDTGDSTLVNAPWAVEFWMQVQGANPDNRQDYLLNFGNANPAFVYDLNPDLLEVYASAAERTGDGPVIADSNWHHVFWVFYGDGTVGVADRMDAIIDGTPIPYVRNSFARGLGLNASLIVGAGTPGYNGFQGRLDEIAVYDLSDLATEAAVAARVEQMAASHAAASKAEPPPALSIRAAGNQLTLGWSGSGYVLQSTSTIANPASWTDVAGGQNSPYTTAPSPGVNTFYRLIKR